MQTDLAMSLESSGKQESATLGRNCNSLMAFEYQEQYKLIFNCL